MNRRLHVLFDLDNTIADLADNLITARDTARREARELAISKAKTNMDYLWATGTITTEDNEYDRAMAYEPDMMEEESNV